MTLSELINGKRVLYLSLSEKPFEVMVTGEKTNEYRKTSKWLLSRLKHKDGTEKVYDLICYSHGYSKHRPYFVSEYNGVTLNTDQHLIRFSNGLDVSVEIGDTIIFGGNTNFKRDFLICQP